MERDFGTRVKMFIVFLLMCAGAFLLFMEPSNELEEADKWERVTDRGLMEWEQTRDPATGEIPTNRLLKARQIAAGLFKKRGIAPLPEWTEHGPAATGGRTRALLFDRRDPTGSTMWAGGVAGGLWYSSAIYDSLPGWQPVNDFFENIAISSIVQDPLFPDTLYFGTGEGWFNFDAVRGLGIWKSTNGGQNWYQLPSTADSSFFHVQKLLIDASGNLLAATRQAGVLRSKDGGDSWEQILGTGTGQANHNRAADLEMGADGSLYATFGILNQGGVFRSDFTLHGAQTGNAGTWENITPPGSFQRMEIACAPADPGKVYVLGQSPDTYQVSGLFSSDNKGTTWVPHPIPNLGSQAWYDLIAAVHPLHPEEVYVGGVFSYRSTDGGNTWEGLTLGHVDHHIIAFNPINPDVAVWGTDGGVYLTTNVQAVVPVFESKNEGYRVTQFYSCAIHPKANRPEFLGGTQDNGSHWFTSPYLNHTVEVTGGDGGFCHIDQVTPSIQISSFVRNQYRITLDGWLTKKPVNFSFSEGWFINPTDYDSENKILYAANEAGQYRRWAAVDSCQVGSCSELVYVSAFGNGKVTHLAVDKFIPNRLFVGLNNGRIVRVDQADVVLNTTGTLLNGGSGMPEGWVSCIAQSETDPDHLLATYSNYGVESVWETRDAGINWLPAENNLPDMPVRWALFAPGSDQTVLLATELGVWFADSLAGPFTFWQPASAGLANTRVDMLQSRSSDGNIIAATHGRGMFSTSFFEDRTVGWAFRKQVIQEAAITPDTLVCGMPGQYVFLPVGLSRPVSANLNAHVKVSPQSTALSGKDFVLTDTLLHFKAGGEDTLYIPLFVVDDANTEDSTVLLLELFSSDSLYSVLDSLQTAMILFTGDNDPEPTSLEVQTVCEVGLDNLPEFYVPFRGDYTDLRCQMLYLPDELMQAGLVEGKLEALGFFVEEARSAKPYSGFSIKLKRSSLNSFAGSYEDGMTLVFEQDIIVQPGWNMFKLDSLFYWDGQSALVVEICFDNSMGTKSDIVRATQTDFFSVQYRRENFGSGCAFPFPATLYDQRPNLRIVNLGGIYPAEDAMAGASIKLWPGLVNHCYADSFRIVASIHLSAGEAEACASGSVYSSGQGKDYPSVLLGKGVTQKSFLIESNAGVSGKVIDLFFSPAELAIWGDQALQLNVIASQVPFSELANGNFSLVEQPAIMVDTFGYDGNIRYRFTAKGPYPYFSLTDAALYTLPSEFLELQVEEQRAGPMLSWSGNYSGLPVAQEIWRSLEGVTWERIARLKGDVEPRFLDSTIEKSGWIYYQVQVVFSDSSRMASDRVAFFQEPEEIIFQLYPNPVRETLVINRTKGASSLYYQVFRYDGSTQVSGWWDKETEKLTITCKNWPAGLYFVELFSRGERMQVFKLIKQ